MSTVFDPSPGQTTIQSARFGHSWLQDEEIQALVNSGTRTLSLAGTQAIGDGDAKGALELLRFLRDAGSWGLQVRWTLRLGATVEALSLAHLEPPTDAEGVSPGTLARWRAGHRYGLCYYRRGPDFILVKDVRDSERPAYFVLDEDPLVEAFTTLLTPQRVTALQPELLDALSELRAERLVLQLDEWAVVLPSRVRIWPIPYAGI